MGVSLLEALKHMTDGTPQKTTAVYDLFLQAAAYRDKPEDKCLELFKKAFFENRALAIKCLFYIRDIRAGLGERRFFRICLKWLALAQQDTAIAIMPEIPNFGRWDDLFVLLDTPVQKNMADLLVNQLIKDLHSANPSLLAKWMKSCNATSKESRQTANKLRVLLRLNQKQYREMLTLLRKKINLTETQMSEHDWNKIKYEHVPAEALKKYAYAFWYHDKDRFMSAKNIKLTGKVPHKPYYDEQVMLQTLNNMRYGKLI